MEVCDEAGNSAKAVMDLEPTCFAAGTKVLTESGLKNIEEIQIGEKVYALNMDTKEKELKNVLEVSKGYSKEIYEIVAENTVIQATPTHPFYIEGKGWVRAYQLEEGEKLTAVGTDEKLVVSSIKCIYYEEPVTVYNLTIGINHNYLITEYNILVHNGSAGCVDDVESTIWYKSN